MKITNSILQAYREYKQEVLCGELFDKVYLKREVFLETTDAQNAGHWFEYEITGALPAYGDGSSPEPKLTKKGELTAIYKHLENHINTEKNVLKDVKDPAYGVKIEHQDNGFSFNGTLDVYAVDQIRDIKTTGHITNKWDDYGWVNIETKKHVDQAKFYLWLVYKMTGKVYRFFFDVYSNKDNKCKIIEVKVIKKTLEDFEENIIKEAKAIKAESEIGFQLYPDAVKCSNCLLSESCKHKSNEPPREEVIL